MADGSSPSLATSSSCSLGLLEAHTPSRIQTPLSAAAKKLYSPPNTAVRCGSIPDAAVRARSARSSLPRGAQRPAVRDVRTLPNDQRSPQEEK
ncbi:hypothetical protein MRX96_016560 [Rhipicephalus microplus]